MAAQPIWDKRMLQLIDEITAKGEKGLFTAEDVMVKIKANPKKASQVRQGKQSFTAEQILSFAKAFNLSTDFIYGLSDRMHKTNGQSVKELLSEAIRKLK